jgi:hypothetical protein
MRQVKEQALPADEDEQGREAEEASARKTVSAKVVHDAIWREGEGELSRPSAALAWSGLAAGLAMGFSLIGEGVLAKPSRPCAMASPCHEARLRPRFRHRNARAPTALHREHADSRDSGAREEDIVSLGEHSSTLERCPRSASCRRANRGLVFKHRSLQYRVSAGVRGDRPQCDAGQRMCHLPEGYPSRMADRPDRLARAGCTFIEIVDRVNPRLHRRDWRVYPRGRRIRRNAASRHDRGALGLVICPRLSRANASR